MRDLSSGGEASSGSPAGSSISALAPALQAFADLLAKRLGSSVFTTEDAVRYTFFAAVTQTLEIKPEGIVLEHNHSDIAGARIDTWIPAFGGRAYALEFKFDRPIPSERNLPRTQKAGQILKDLFRLARLHLPNSTDAVFIYLTTREMAGYFRNPANGLHDLFCLPAGHSLKIDDGYLKMRAETLRKASGEVIPCTVHTLLSRDLPCQHELRAYGVHRDTQI